jgi:hypothetical protein
MVLVYKKAGHVAIIAQVTMARWSTSTARPGWRPP